MVLLYIPGILNGHCVLNRVIYFYIRQKVTKSVYLNINDPLSSKFIKEKISSENV